MDDLRKHMEHLLSTVHATSEKVDKIEKALLGDPLEQRVGILETIKIHQHKIEEHDELIDVVNKKTKTRWGSIAASSAGGIGIGAWVSDHTPEWLSKLLHLIHG